MESESQAEKDWKWLEWILLQEALDKNGASVSSLHGAALELPRFYLSDPVSQVSFRFYKLVHVRIVCF